GLTNNNVYALLEDRGGNVWVGTGGGAVCRIDGVSFNHFSTREVLVNSAVNCILEESDSKRWLGTNDGLIRITENSIENFTGSDDSKRLWVPCMHKDAKGRIWLGIDNQGF
ncbi:MAG: two-component regulator propeller domain-containing protein, partial [Flavobacteriales bacterium]